MKVLTWEENRWIRRLIRANLEADGLQVCEAESEVECVEIAESQDCELLLLSLDSLNWHTVRIIEQMRQEKGRDMPVLLVLSEEPTDTMISALHPALCIRRPFDAQDLARSVQILLTQSAV